eukprot:CAMPEP_0115004076 /NCGR_PEP_ID=MMETSP0216-20121206/18989_1 /TAXON_ID=223996 /ORGANISM="Protocruzia adherens, Strain Boccale" /LENGTH=178 /DNA_ID=CAMNT_0002369999 /DNA_START=33 /DNA_END=564 /DNA_ORIENTATION=-
MNKKTKKQPQLTSQGWDGKQYQYSEQYNIRDYNVNCGSLDVMIAAKRKLLQESNNRLKISLIILSGSHRLLNVPEGFSNQQQGVEGISARTPRGSRLESSGESDDTTTDSSAGMTSGLGVVMSSSAQIVLISVDNNGSADNRVFTSKLDQLIFNFVHGFVPGPSRDDVSQITNVSFFV